MSNSDATNESKKKPFLVMRDYQSQQACILLALLNLHYDIVCERPFKSTSRSLQFIKISKLINSNGTINVKQMTTERINNLLKEDNRKGITEKTLLRRKDVYKVTEHLHVICDLALQIGVHFDIKTDKRTIEQDRFTIRKIVYDGIIFDKVDIVQIGTNIHKMLIDLFVGLNHTSTLTLPKCDTEVMSYLLE